MFGILNNGKLEYAPVDKILDNGVVIFNYNQDVDAMIKDGYKEVINKPPVFDDTQYVVVMGYSETMTTITILYEVKIIEVDDKKVEQMDLCVQMFAQSLSDEAALSVPLVYPEFKHPSNYKKDDKIRYEGILYKVLQTHATQEDWNPLNAPSLYVKVIAQQPGGEIPEWEQPSAENAYMKGDKVKCEGKIFESLLDNNVWKPTEYPASWKEVTE